MKLLILTVACFIGANAQVRFLAARDGAFPNDAIIGGNTQGQQLPVCRVSFAGDMVVGGLNTLAGHCSFPWGGRENTVRIYDVAAGSRFSWRAYTQGQLIPNNAVFAGFTANRDRVHVCRTRHVGGQFPGKLLRGMCYIANLGLEHTYPNSDILLDP